MKKFLLLLTSILSFQLSASHNLGAEISWECQGNGDYVFTLVLYHECGVGAIAAGPTITISNSLGSPITLTRPSTGGIVEISPICNSNTPSDMISCASTLTGSGAIEAHIYKSSPITLAGPIPTSGARFAWTACCRPGVIQNTASNGFYVECVMYPGPNNNGCAVSSPSFLDFPIAAQSKSGPHTLSEMASYNPGDSLHYSFDGPYQGAGNPVLFNAGYSSASPLPNASSNAANGPITMDAQTGTAYLNVTNASSGGYAYGVKVEQWQNGAKIAEVHRDFSIFYIDAPGVNNEPAVAIDTSIYTFLTTVGHIYYTDAFVGDTLAFQIQATDFDFNSGTGAFQTIYASGKSSAINMNLGGTPGNITTPWLRPSQGQTGFAQALNNDVDFQWAITSSHYQDPNSTYTFVFEMADDFCPTPEVVQKILVVNIRGNVTILNKSNSICEGESVTLTALTKSGSYQWADSNGPIAGGTNASVTVSPTTSTWYYLTDPSLPGFIDSTEVIVEPLGNFNIAFDSINGRIQMTNTVLGNGPVWYYNGIPFFYPYDTLRPYLPGFYWADLTTANCYYASDTILATSVFNFGIIMPNNGTLIDTASKILNSLGFTFTINHSGAFVTIYITGVSAGTPKRAQNTLGIRIYDPQDNLVFSKDTLITGVNNEVIALSANFNFQANTEYKFVIEGDSALDFRLFKDVATPYDPFNNGITVTSLVTGPAGAIPTQPTNLAPVVGFGKQQFVGLEENALSKVKIYPNPASEIITISTEEELSLSVKDVSGKTVRLDWRKVEGLGYTADVAQLPNGVYLVQINTGRETAVKKFIVNK